MTEAISARRLQKEMGDRNGSQFESKIKQRRERRNMLGWTLIFRFVALIAGVLGFAGIAGAATGIAQILFVIFLVLFLASLIARGVSRRG